VNSAVAWGLGLVLLSPIVALANGDKSALQVRLLTPITSYSRSGQAFQAVVIGPVLRGGLAALPTDSTLHGTIRRVRGVGLGFRRERASLDIHFERCELPDGTDLRCEAELETVDNAREEVLANNRVRGVLAASNANSWFSGVWYRPPPGFVHRSATGLTGASGIINARYATGPVGAAAVIASRLLLFRMPEPEIEFPAGTDMLVRVRANAYKNHTSPERNGGGLPEEISHWLKLQPAEINQPNGKPVADLINVALVGSREQVEAAFHGSGWTKADALTPKTFARTYGAYSSMRAYPGSPVSPLLYLGRAPDLVMQRTFNSVAKRHHVRLWSVDLGGGELWLGAATHDTGVTFDWRRMAVTHRIDPAIDVERSKLLNDLTYTGCAVATEPVLRPDLAQQDAKSGRAVTDGSLAIVLVRPCSSAVSGPVGQKRRQSTAALIGRRVVLETRHYWTRSNLYYWTQRAARWTFSSSKPRPQPAKAVIDDK
jgi:hypothetical protein